MICQCPLTKILEILKMGILLKKMNLKITIVIIIIINLLNINTRNFKIRNFILSLTNTNSLITPKIALGSTESGINKIAAEITVRIDGQNRSGSGVIVEKQGDTYYILTNWHVVNKVGDYQVRTPDGKIHPVYYTLIKQVPNVDLAVIPFSSSQNYPIAEAGDPTQLVPGTKVFVGGWPRSGSNLQQRIFLSTPGVVKGRQQPVAGYSLLYDNLVRAGMSGGPVLNEEGRLVAINGIVKLQENSDVIVSGGIEINTFWNWRQRVSLPIVSQVPPTIQTPASPTETTNNSESTTTGSPTETTNNGGGTTTGSTNEETTTGGEGPPEEITDAGNEEVTKNPSEETTVAEEGTTTGSPSPSSNSGCKTVSGKPCILPFIYKQQKYT